MIEVLSNKQACICECVLSGCNFIGIVVIGEILSIVNYEKIKFITTVKTFDTSQHVKDLKKKPSSFIKGTNHGTLKQPRPTEVMKAKSSALSEHQTVTPHRIMPLSVNILFYFFMFWLICL